MFTDVNTPSPTVQDDCMSVLFPIIFEFVGVPEEVKFDQNKTMWKHETYLHNTSNKFPSLLSTYNKDSMLAGYYSVTGQLVIIKGKMEVRKLFTPLEPSSLDISRFGMATHKKPIPTPSVNKVGV